MRLREFESGRHAPGDRGPVADACGQFQGVRQRVAEIEHRAYPLFLPRILRHDTLLYSHRMFDDSSETILHLRARRAVAVGKIRMQESTLQRISYNFV